MAVINGTPGNDSLTGDLNGIPEDDEINGFAGEDTLEGLEVVLREGIRECAVMDV